VVIIDVSCNLIPFVVKTVREVFSGNYLHSFSHTNIQLETDQRRLVLTPIPGTKLPQKDEKSINSNKKHLWHAPYKRN